jgi:coenzyme PQQ biosynthesis protein PqqD
VIAPEKRLKIAPLARLRWDRIDGRHVLLSPERGLALNPTATEVVKLCDGTRTASEIARRCVDTYAGDSVAEREGIEADVRAWLAELLARSLVVEYSDA